jgi:hypothetical protein
MSKVGLEGVFNEVKPVALGYGAEGSPWQAASAATPLPVGAPGTAYTDASIASLSAGQAAHTATVLAANANRKALMINPPADCILTIATAATAGWPLFANVPNTIVGQECPTNALYLVGLSAGAAVTIWEG